MKKLFILSFFCLFVLTSFTSELSLRRDKSYAYVTGLEQILGQEEATFNDIFTSVVEVPCGHGASAVALQFNQYYDAELKSENSQIVYRHTSAWIYDSYDKAVAKRREDMAKARNKKKTINSFSVTCE